jgi:hypothetical protein
MKKIIGIITICATALVTPVLAQTPAPATAQAPAGCTEEAKTALYTEFTTNRTSTPTKAYEAAKKYLACSQAEDQYTAYLKKWSAAYDKEFRKARLTQLLYGEKKFAEAFQIGKEILVDDPENLKAMIDLGYTGYLATITAKNESFNNESLVYARKAIQLIESGKVPENWSAFKTKEEALAYLYNAIGRLTLKSNSPETLTSLIKAAQFEVNDVKKDPWIYFFIAAAYESGPYAKLSADYKAKCEGKDLTPECKLALENINQVVDRMIDVYARAVAFAGADAKYAASKKEWMDSLSTWYKYRHSDSDAGLTEVIAGIMSKPLPPEPTPLTVLPPTTTPTTTTTPTSGAGSTGAGNSPTAAPTAVKTTTTTAAPVTTTAPKSTTTTSTTTPVKPKPKDNHRRRS